MATGTPNIGIPGNRSESFSSSKSPHSGGNSGNNGNYRGSDDSQSKPPSGGYSSGQSGSSPSGSDSGGSGGGGDAPIDILDLIDGLDDPNFWLIQKMKREAEMLAAMERAARSRRKAYSVLFANSSEEDFSNRRNDRGQGKLNVGNKGGTSANNISSKRTICEFGDPLCPCCEEDTPQGTVARRSPRSSGCVDCSGGGGTNHILLYILALLVGPDTASWFPPCYAGEVAFAQWEMCGIGDAAIIFAGNLLANDLPFATSPGSAHCGDLLPGTPCCTIRSVVVVPIGTSLDSFAVIGTIPPNVVVRILNAGCSSEGVPIN